MKRSHWVLVLTLASVTLMLAPTASADSPGKVDLCHRTASDAGGVPEWRLLSVSNKSLDQHVEHGDGLPGEEVPGSNGELVFDEACGVLVEGEQPGEPGGEEPDGGEDPDNPGDPGSETVFAIAYSDIDQSGSYESTIDVLIAKFVDGTGDGLPGAGDLIVTDRYPLDLGMGAFGNFGVTEHAVTGLSVSGTKCLVSTASGSFIWDASTSLDGYQEGSGTDLSFLTDWLSGGGSDVIVADPASPSQPGEEVSTFAAESNDDPFLEVEHSCSS